MGYLVSMQAVTRVNAEQASKRAMREPIWLNFREGRSCWGRRASKHPAIPPG
jgi:hypothetical protein